MSHIKSGHIGVYSLNPQDRGRLVLGIEALMQFGPRLIAEVLLEVSARDIEDVLRLLDGYARIAPVVGALDGFAWTAPIRRAARGGRAA